MTVAWFRRLAGAASSARSTSACEAPGSSGGGGAGAPRPPCANTLVDVASAITAIMAMRFIGDLPQILYTNHNRGRHNTTMGARTLVSRRIELGGTGDEASWDGGDRCGHHHGSLGHRAWSDTRS